MLFCCKPGGTSELGSHTKMFQKKRFLHWSSPNVRGADRIFWVGNCHEKYCPLYFFCPHILTNEPLAGSVLGILLWPSVPGERGKERGKRGREGRRKRKKESRKRGGVEEQGRRQEVEVGWEPTRSDSTQVETYSNSSILKIPRVRHLGFEVRSEENQSAFSDYKLKNYTRNSISKNNLLV